MANTIHVDIVSAEGQIHSGSAEMVFVPASQGEIGIAPRHAPLITRLLPGEVRVQAGGVEQQFFVNGGILEVQPHAVTLLTDLALRAKDLDEAAAIEAKKRAEDMIANQKGEVDIARAQAELAEASARLHMLQRLRRKAGG